VSFVAARIRRRGTGSDADGRWARARLESQGWRNCDLGFGVQIAVQAKEFRRLAYPDGEVLLIGEITGEPNLSNLDARSLETLCSSLAKSIWGSYVALILDREGGLQGVFRDPSGALDCVIWRSSEDWTVSSDTPDWLFGPDRPSPGVAWPGIARLLGDPSSLSSLDLLDGACTVTPGELVLRDGSTRCIWSPGAFAASSHGSVDAEGLRNVVDLVVPNLTRGREGLLVEISGGLDSAIVAASLRRADPSENHVWFNAYGPYSESDERAYADAVANTLGVDLTLHRRTIADLAAGLSFDHPRTPRPSLNRMDAAYDALLADVCDAQELDGIVTGKGGDVVFGQTASSTILADQIHDHGLRALAQPTGVVLARRMRRSVWRVMRGALAAARDPRPPAKSGFRLLHPDVALPESASHPWLRHLHEVPPAKRLQIAGLVSHLAMHGLSRRSARAKLIHPLLSQPVMEACLATPLYQLASQGHERLLARQAFVDRLPESVLARRSKGELGAYYGKVVAANLARLRTHLLEGHLSNQGLIDRAETEQALQPDDLIWRGDYVEIMTLALVESWCRAWA